MEWRNRVSQYLGIIYGKEVSSAFIRTTQPYSIAQYQRARGAGIGYIEGLQARELKINDHSKLATDYKSSNIISSNNKVFIVHGHDAELKEKVARFILNIGLDPIILHEKPNLGKTIIEKFENYSDVSYAIVLLTPDDQGNSIEDNTLNKRARQNVIMELGYFIGKLGRSNVCALKKKEVEIPSDYLGIIYVDADNDGVWKNKIAQELIQAGLKIKLEGILS